MEAAEENAAPEKRGFGRFARNYRSTICARLFFAAVINRADRQLIGALKPSLQTERDWNGIRKMQTFADRTRLAARRYLLHGRYSFHGGCRFTALRF